MEKNRKCELNRRSFLKLGGAGAAYTLGSTVLGPAQKAIAAPPPNNNVYVAEDDTFRGTGPTGNYDQIRLGFEKYDFRIHRSSCLAGPGAYLFQYCCHKNQLSQTGPGQLPSVGNSQGPGVKFADSSAGCQYFPF